jgi:hypothetical protein
VNLSPGLDGDEGEWRWLAMVSRDGGGDRAEQSRGEGGHVEARRKQNGSRTPSLSYPRPDKPGAPTWVSDDRR